MADKKISGCDPATAPSGVEMVVVVQNGVTKRAPLSAVKQFLKS